MSSQYTVFTRSAFNYISLAFFLAAVTVCNGDSSSSTYSNQTTAGGSLTTLQGVVWSTQPVEITIAANVTEIETFYPGGGAPSYTTFTLVGPTTFTTSYIDGNDVYYAYSTSITTYSIAPGTTKTEHLLASIDKNHLTGDLRSGGYPWEVSTTFLLKGPTVFATQCITVGQVEEVSPPYVLESEPASNLAGPTTASKPVTSPAPMLSPAATTSTVNTATVYSPQRVSSSPSSKSSTLSPTSSPTPSLLSLASTSAPPTNPQLSPSTIPPPPTFTIAGVPASVLNPSAVLIGSQTLLLNGPTLTLSSTPLALNSAGIILGSILGSATVSLPSPLTLAGEPATVLNPSAVLIGSQTLLLNGPTLTISSTPLALNSAGIVLGSATVPIPLPAASPASTSSAGLGGVILSGLGQSSVGGGTSAVTSALGGPSITPSSGGVRGRDGRGRWRSWGVGVLLGWGVWCW
ncbi:hypothetical protein MMC13_003484 [Lambiella insularis]|nr:hypothetical protein [Lambiella insularis]